ncbi:MAG: M48 family metallopeptidase [Thermoanaerobaculia bacterium]|nr:M48 family metallopeptidase [Thermoanaerobaculia bacterium]
MISSLGRATRGKSPIDGRPSILNLLLIASLLLATTTPAGAQDLRNDDLFGKSAMAAEQALTGYGTWDGDSALRRVADIGYRLAGQTQYLDYPLTFFVVDMREPNAFALPGGQVFVTRGMLELDLSDDQLAGLLGHEISHVTLSHGTKMQRRATLLNILSQAAMVGVVVAADSIGGERAPEGVPLGRNPDQISPGARVQGALAATMILGELLMRGYSREFEDQADSEGQRLAAAAGFDPLGAADLFDLMEARLPQTHEYGYWRTHPFFDDRVAAARARGKLLATLEAKPIEDYRRGVQKRLLDYDTDRIPRADDDEKAAVRRFLDTAALTAWPQGAEAERLRTDALQRLRDEILEGPETSRDYGRLLGEYRKQRAEVAELSPESDYLAVLEREIEALDAANQANYPAAEAILTEGIYQTEFLETFLSNYPDSPEFSSAAIALATSYARVNKTRESVERYLEAWRAAPQSELGQRSRRGLELMVPDLENLSALGQILEACDSMLDDSTGANAEEIQRLSAAAAARLDTMAGRFEDLANGSEYLRRFPEGDHADRVALRLDEQAEKLYGEVILYQGIGDSLKALDRIQRILLHAPLSPAAKRLSERALLASH